MDLDNNQMLKRIKSPLVKSLVILTALYACFNLFIYFSTNESLDAKNLKLAIERSLTDRPEGVFLKDALPFQWDKVCIYPGYGVTSPLSIEKIYADTGIVVDKNIELPNLRRTFFKYNYFFIFSGRSNKYFSLKANHLFVNGKKYFFLLPKNTVKAFCAEQNVFLKPDKSEFLFILNRKQKASP